MAGIVEPGKLAHLFVQKEKLEEIIDHKGVSRIYLKLDNPGNTDLVKKQLEAKYEDYPIYSMADLRGLY